jgi:hypothetical protein
MGVQHKYFPTVQINQKLYKGELNHIYMKFRGDCFIGP